MIALLSCMSISYTQSFVSLNLPVVPSSLPRIRARPIHLTAYRNDDNYYPAASSSPNAQELTTTAASGPAKKPSSSLPNGGRLTLLGAGPGDPDLLTVAAYKLLQDENNLVIVDRLVSDDILAVVRGEVRRANKYPGCAEQAQNEIYDWCKQGLREGRHVVRLKIGEPQSWFFKPCMYSWICFFLFVSLIDRLYKNVNPHNFVTCNGMAGDPFVFGRGGEEVLEFRKFGVEPTVVPVSLSW